MPATDRIDTLRQRIHDGDDISSDDQTVLEAFADELALRQSEKGDHRREKLLRNAVIIAEQHGHLADALTDRDTAESIVRWIHDTYSNPETNVHYRHALRQCGQYVVGDDDIPPALEWISTTVSRSVDRRPDPAKMYRWDDHVKPMLDACQNRRDEAVIALQWDAGLRSGELYAPDSDEYVTIGDFRDSQFGLQVSASGKQGRRSVTLIPSVSYIQPWLNNHPRSDDPDAPFVASVRDGSLVSKRAFINIFKHAADRADITPPAAATPTRFRKSSASYYASQGLRQPHLEDRYGWVRGSDAAARYVSVFAEKRRREVAAIHGLDVPEDGGDELAPIECPRCGIAQPRDQEFCEGCGQALDQEAAQVVEEAVTVLDDELVAADEVERRERLLGARRTIERKPQVLSVEELRHVLSSL